MTPFTIQLPDSLTRELRECADREGVTMDQLLASAAAEKLSALLTVDHLRDRARRACRARREDFLAFLDGTLDVPPQPGDDIEPSPSP